MKMKKIISALLIAVLALGMFLPNASAQAAGEDTGSPVADDSGVVLSKTVSGTAEGGYTLTLEAYVTGQKIVTEIKEDIPTDIVLVLDQSGSMGLDKNKITSYGFREYTNKTNSDYHDVRYNQNDENKRNLWYQLPDGNYAAVSVERTSSETGNYTYTRLYDSGNNRNYRGSYIYEQARSQTLYYLHGGQYHPMTVTRREIENGWNDYYRYTYTCTQCNQLITTTDDDDRPDRSFQFYTRTAEVSYTYTYSYTINGVKTDIGTSTGANTIPTGFTLHERYVVSSVTRTEALKNALNIFSEQVAEKAKGPDGTLGTEDDVDHKIAVVGFGSGNEYSDYYYTNTELFIGATQYRYDSASAQYGNAFQDMSTAQGVANVNASIAALDDEGATHIDLGLVMANGILSHQNNAIPEGETRNRVVIVFADGFPSTYSDYSPNVATAAYNQASTIKNKDIPVYTVGVFSGADATSAGSVGNNASEADIGNYVLQHISNNNGTPQNPSYYMSAGDADTLTNIFRQLSDQIESGGATSTLTETTVVQDIIAKEFTLPAGADASAIKVFTADCTGKDANNQLTFNNKTPFNATVSISADRTGISVTNFNYSENWVGTETAANGSVKYRGKKLIIEIPIVVKPDFLGGNKVATNGAASGIYIPDGNNGLKNVAYFEIPKVDVPLKTVSQPTADQHVYLGNPADIGGLVTQVGDFTVNGTQYTVDGINNGHVTLTYSVTDKDSVIRTFTIPAGTSRKIEGGVIKWYDASGNEVTLNWVTADGVEMYPVLTEDLTTYNASCTVTPITSGTYLPVSSDPIPASVYIYKPEITFADSTVNFGGTTPNEKYFNDTNYKGTVWKNPHANKTPSGTAPTLTLNYTAEGFGTSATVTAKEDVPVVVTVKNGNTDITNYVTFKHDTCTVNGCTFNEKTEQFVVHVRYAELTITKEVTGDIDQNQAFVFRVKGPDLDTYVVIYGEGSVTISGLAPEQSYNVTEQVDWSWRYIVVDKLSQDKTLAAYPSTNEVTFTNTRSIGGWLSGDNYAVNNYGNATPDRGVGDDIPPTAGN